MSSDSSLHKTVEIPSEMGSAERLARQLLEEVRANNFSDEELFGIHLSLEEALQNAVSHGCCGDATKKVSVKWLVNSDEFDVWVTDEGCGFKPDKLPDPRCKDNIYKSSGRGVLLMRSYMDLVEFNEAGNSVHMKKRKG